MMNLQQIWDLTQSSVNAWIDDFAPSMGAAISYYTLFSLAPMLIISIAVAGFFFGAEAARGEIFGQLQGLVGEEGAAAIQGLLKSANDPTDGVIATLLGLVALVVGSTTVFAELQSDLDRIWRSPVEKGGHGLWFLIRTRLLSFGMVLGMGFIILVSLIMSAVLAALGKWWGGYFGGWETLLEVFNFVFSFTLITASFAAIYKFMPRVKIAWRDVWIGAFVTALLFSVGKFLIGLYIGKTGVASSFGAAGSFVVVMVWVYFSAQIFLLGAEFTWVYAHRHGSKSTLGARAAQPSIASRVPPAPNRRRRVGDVHPAAQGSP